MVIDFVPSVCKDTKDGKKKVPATFSGKIRLRAPTFDEKYQYIEESGLDLDEEGNMESKGGQLKTIRRLVGFSKKHYEEITLKRISDGVEFKSFEQMEVDSSCDAILIDVGSQLINGFKPTKN